MSDRTHATLCLFIGGPLDGQHVPVDDSWNHFEAVQTTFDLTLSKVVYKRTVFTQSITGGGSRSFYVFALNKDTVLEDLIKGYRPPVQEHGPGYPAF